MQAQAFLSRHQPTWHTAWQAMGLAPADASLLRALTACYCQAHRHYHTLEHLDACLRHLQDMRNHAQHLHEVTLALWFHDARYTIGATDNERRSADWASDALLAAGASREVTERVHALIMVTRHETPPETPDEALLLDVDLAILGAPAAVFDAYEQQVFREYQGVPPAAFRSNRARILQGFLDRPRIYHTPQFSARREAQARANLGRSILALTH